MRNLAIFTNTKTKELIPLSNRKLAWQLYVKICEELNIGYVMYSRFTILLRKGPIEFLHYEISWVEVYDPRTVNFNNLYAAIISGQPKIQVRQQIINNVLALSPDITKGVPIDFTKHRQGNDSEQTSPDQ